MSLAGFSDTYANRISSCSSRTAVTSSATGMTTWLGRRQRLGGGTEWPKASIVELLGRLQVKTEQVKYLGISTFTRSHRRGRFAEPQATLLIGEGDWDVLQAEQPPQRMKLDEFAAWRALLARTWIPVGAR